MPADPAAPHVTRRTAVVGGGLTIGLMVGACGEQARPGGSARTSREEGDDAILAAVRAELGAAVGLVAATRVQHRALRARLADLETAHVIQLGVLDPDAVSAAAPTPAIPGDATVALSRLRASEQRLQRRLLTWAVAVDSGPLARVLAAASAGTAQHLATLSEGGTA